jgi:hypothetical protein
VSVNGSRVNDGLEISRIEHPLADVWIGRVKETNFDYTYGGTRMVAHSTDDDSAVAMLHELATTESLLKNLLINSALEEGALDSFGERLPEGFVESRVGGARCIIRPRHAQTGAFWDDPDHPDFITSISSVFAEMGNYLNEQEGYIKLTPDFGRYASLSNLLREFTPHVLGISCEVGGCGGKTSYTTTGVVTAFEHFQFPPDTPVTVIGSDGAMGTEFLEYVTGAGFRDIAVSDIAYQRENTPAPWPSGLRKMTAELGTFTSDCLSRGGVIVATTWGRELQNSDLSALVPRAHLLLAHNLSIPDGRRGVELARRLTAREVTTLPGQILTLGGALTTRLEWFWRQARPTQPFDKPLAHDVVRAVVGHWTDTSLRHADNHGITPYEAMGLMRHSPPQPDL